MADRRFFSNRWWIVFGCTMSMLVAQAPITLFSFGLFIKPIGAEFGWDRAAMSAASGIGSLMSGIAIPIVGILMDRYGVRRVLVPVIILFATSFAAISLTPPSLVIFITLYAIAGALGSGQGPLGYVKSISGWFDDRRGLALGIAMAGIGLGAAMVPQYAQFIISHFGWRYAYVGLGALLLVIALPSVLLFVREPAEAVALRTHQSVDQLLHAHQDEVLPGLDTREALGSVRFWVLAAVLISVSTVVNGTAVHTVPLLTDHGYTPAAAAALMIAVGLSTMAGRLLSGFLVDKFFAPHVAAFFFLLPCLGLYLLNTTIAPTLGIITLGLASGTEVDMIGYMTSRYFGLKRFGMIYGWLFAVFTAGSALGPYILGVTFETYHSYTPALIGFGGLLVIASALILCLGPYRYPVTRKQDAAKPLVAVPQPT